MVLVHDPSALRTKHVAYEPIKLRQILDNYQTGTCIRYKKLPIDTIKTIRYLKFNRKRRRHRYTAQKRLIQYDHDHGQGSQLENLTKVKRKGYRDDTNIILGTINIQSIKIRTYK